MLGQPTLATNPPNKVFLDPEDGSISRLPRRAE